MKFILVLLLIFNYNVYGFTPIKKGDPSKVDGFVVTVDQEKSLRKINEDKETLEKLQEINKQRDILAQIQITHHKEQIKEIQKTEWEKRLWFIGGVFVSGLAMWGASRLGR